MHISTVLPPQRQPPGATNSTSLSSGSHGKGGGGAWDFFPCAVPALAMAVFTYPHGFLISPLSITFFVCQKKQDCKSAAAGTVGMCVTGSLLAAVGKYVYGVWEIYFPCHMNVLFHGSLTGYAHFHGAPPTTPAPGATCSTSVRNTKRLPLHDFFRKATALF